jgi:hypothetical protein
MSETRRARADRKHRATRTPFTSRISAGVLRCTIASTNQEGALKNPKMYQPNRQRNRMRGRINNVDVPIPRKLIASHAALQAIKYLAMNKLPSQSQSRWVPPASRIRTHRVQC